MKRNTVLILIIISITISTFYWSVSKFRDYTATSMDIDSYKKLVYAPLKNDLYAPYAYRILTPKLVYLLLEVHLYPVLSKVVNVTGKDPFDIGFAFINLVFSILTSIILFYFLLNFNIKELYAFLGSIFYLTSYYVALWNYLPLIDAAGHFFFIMGLFLIIKKKYFLLFLNVLIGMWAKETTSLLFFAALLYNHKDRYLMLASIPGILIYVCLRIFWFDNPPFFEGSIKAYWDLFIRHYSHVQFYFDLFVRSFFIFLPISIYAIYKNWQKLPKDLKRLMLLMIPIYAQTFIATDAGRLLFYSFPFVFYGTTYLLQTQFVE